jgi:hypothetical protein
VGQLSGSARSRIGNGAGMNSRVIDAVFALRFSFACSNMGPLKPIMTSS